MPLKILLADDSMTAQNMGKKILTDAGHEVVAVSNGAAAAKKLGEKFDVIILDVFMPGYSGLEICEKVKANPDSAKTPVLLTVGKMEPYKPEEGLKVKADGVIVKPFEASDLLAAISRMEKKLAPPKEADYEKTMIFKAPQVKEFEDDTYAEWKETTALDLQKAAQEAMAMAAAKNAETAAAASAPAMGSPDETVNYQHPILAQSGGTAAAPAMEAVPAMMMEETSAAAPPISQPAAPASGFDMSAPASAVYDAAPAAAPAMGLMEELLATPPSASASEVSYAAPAIPGVDDLTAPAVAEVEHHDPTTSLLEPTAAQESCPVHITTDSAVEFTSAPKAADVVVERSPELEHEETEQAEEVHLVQDPALARHDEMHEFVTKVGIEGAEPDVVGYAGAAVPETPAREESVVDSEASAAIAEVASAAPAAAEDDDFEARVAAAMSNFQATEAAAPETVNETVPEVSHHEEQAPAHQSETAVAAVPEYVSRYAGSSSQEEAHEAAAAPVAEAASQEHHSAGAHPSGITSRTTIMSAVEIAAALEAAAAGVIAGKSAHSSHVTSAPEVAEHMHEVSAVAAAPAMEASSSAYAAAAEVERAPEEAAHQAAQPAALVQEGEAAPAQELVVAAPAHEDPTAPPEGMVDTVLVEQMQAAVADMPVAEHPIDHHDHHQTAAQAVAAAPAPIVAETAVSGGRDMELATALAAAVGAEPPPPQIPAPTDALAGLDSNTLAGIVSKVLEKMMPIVLAEISKEMQIARKQ